MAHVSQELLLDTMLTLIQEIRQERQENRSSIRDLDVRVDQAESRLDDVESRIQQINALINNGNNKPENSQNEQHNNPLLTVVLEEQANGRFICPLCKKNYSPKYIKKHIGNVCWPKEQSNRRQSP